MRIKPFAYYRVRFYCAMARGGLSVSRAFGAVAAQVHRFIDLMIERADAAKDCL